MTAQDIQLGSYKLTIDTATGLLVGLRFGDGPDALGHGDGPRLPGASIANVPIDAAPVYRDHTLDGSTLTIRQTFGPLRLDDHYRVVGPLIERRVTVTNDSPEEIQFTGLRIGLRGVTISRSEECLLEAPGNVVRPRLPLAVAARQPESEQNQWPEPYDTTFAPGRDYCWGAGLDDAPDRGPGLLVVHHPGMAWSLLTWYVSNVESARPWVSGDGAAAMLAFDLALAGWLAPGESLAGGAQYILLHEGNYASALAAYRRLTDHTSITPPIYGKAAHALDWAGVYEVHPGQFGGFEGLRQALPAIRALGVDVIYLLPVMKHRNKSGLPWDENWQSTGSPYAIHDFETLEPSLGTEDDFIRMVKTAHDLGLRVVMDFVSQGCSLESRYVTEHPEWFARDERGEMVHSYGWNDTWSFDWANPDYRAYMIQWAKGCVEKYGIDGFRVDAPMGKEPNWDRRIPYHASKTNLGAAEMLEKLRADLLAIKPDAAMICELFGPLWVRSHDVSCDYHPYGMVMQLFERRLTPREFNEYLRDYWAVMPRLPGGQPTPRICFVETHDTRSWPTYALRGSAIQGALLGILVMGGFVPMIWSGQEARQGALIRGLLTARREHRALRTGEFLFNEVTIDDESHYRHSEWDDHPDEWVYALLRYDDEETLFCLASLFTEYITYRFDLPVDKLPLRREATYRLRDVITGELWDEYGKTAWRGEELASFRLTPRMFRPYILRIEETPA